MEMSLSISELGLKVFSTLAKCLAHETKEIAWSPGNMILLSLLLTTSENPI